MIINYLLQRTFHFQTGAGQRNRATGLAAKISIEFSYDFIFLERFQLWFQNILI